MKSFREKSIYIETSEGKLAATVHFPVHWKKTFPSVLLCHGYTGSRMEQRYIFVRLSRKLAENRIGVLRFDYLGGGESEGRFQDQTIDQYIRNASNALAYMKSLPWVDVKRTGLLGYSIGGAVAANLAKDHPELKAAVLWSPVAHPFALFFQCRPDLNPRSILSMEEEYIEYNGWPIGLGFIRSLMGNQPVQALANYPGPVLLCHGEKDHVVPLSHSDDFTKFRDEGKTTERVLLPESGHGYKPLVEEAKLLQETAVWFKKHL